MDPLIASEIMDVGASVEAVSTKPKIPKEIEKLVNAFNNRRQHYFLLFVDGDKISTVSNIQNAQGTIEVLQQSINNHYENL